MSEENLQLLHFSNESRDDVADDEEEDVKDDILCTILCPPPHPYWPVVDDIELGSVNINHNLSCQPHNLNIRERMELTLQLVSTLIQEGVESVSELMSTLASRLTNQQSVQKTFFCIVARRARHPTERPGRSKYNIPQQAGRWVRQYDRAYKFRRCVAFDTCHESVHGAPLSERVGL